jgi:hypothetical protein
VQTLEGHLKILQDTADGNLNIHPEGFTGKVPSSMYALLTDVKKENVLSTLHKLNWMQGLVI